MRAMLTLTILAAGLAVSACNTFAGIGRDVQSVGETVEEAAE